MRLHKLKASESTGTYMAESPAAETDILLMARQFANLRPQRERALDLSTGSVQLSADAAGQLRA